MSVAIQRSSKKRQPTTLSPAERLFATLFVQGDRSQMACYQAAYPRATPATARTQAAQLKKRPHVQAYIQALIDRENTLAVLTRQRKREILAECAQSPKAEWPSRLGAVKIDNEMTGDNAPTRIEGEIRLGAVLANLANTTGLPDGAIDIDSEAIDGETSRKARQDVQGAQDGSILTLPGESATMAEPAHATPSPAKRPKPQPPRKVPHNRNGNGHHKPIVKTPRGKVHGSTNGNGSHEGNGNGKPKLPGGNGGLTPGPFDS